MRMKDVKGYDPVLTDYAVGQIGLNSAAADALAPRKDVMGSHGKYRFVQVGDLTRPISDVVASRTRPKQLDFARGEGSFYTVNHGFEAAISDDDRKESDNQTQLEQDEVLPLTLVLALNREIEVVALTTDSDVPDADAGAKWNAASTTIEADIAAGLTSVVAGTGGFFMPNLMVVPFAVAQAFGGAAEVQQYMVHIFQDVVKSGVMPKSWRGCNVLVPTVMRNTAKENKTPVIANVWGDSVVIAHAAANPYAFATTFTWQLGSVKKRDDLVDCDVFQVRDQRAAVITNADACYRIDKCLTLGD